MEWKLIENLKRQDFAFGHGLIGREREREEAKEKDYWTDREKWMQERLMNQRRESFEYDFSLRFAFRFCSDSRSRWKLFHSCRISAVAILVFTLNLESDTDSYDS